MNERDLSRTIQGEIKKAVGEKATVSVEDSIVRLSGQFPSNQSVVDAGHIAGSFEQVRGVLNEIDYPGKKPLIPPQKVSNELAGKEFDVVIV
ncbi:MAG: hypothetical protein GQ523_09650, partial [Methanophagales archaeon]|nr:hypothetical protein [Methanophagales archaeon]